MVAAGTGRGARLPLSTSRHSCLSIGTKMLNLVLGYFVSRIKLEEEPARKQPLTVSAITCGSLSSFGVVS